MKNCCTLLQHSKQRWQEQRFKWMMRCHNRKQLHGAVGRYHVGKVVVLGEDSSAIKVNRLSPEVFLMVRTEYKTFILPFAQLMSKYQPFNRTPLEQWIPPSRCNLTPAQLQMKTMTIPECGTSQELPMMVFCFEHWTTRTNF